MAPRYGIIGAGIGGIVSARHALDAGGNVTVFEQGKQIGGTWVLEDRTGADEYGVPIHSSMYRGLRSNLPRETMGYLDFEIEDRGTSYVPAEDVLEFVNRYAEKHVPRDRIMLQHQVIQVTRQFNEQQWLVIVRDLLEERIKMFHFDFLLISVGHYASPVFPDHVERKLYAGRQLHSHDFRDPHDFRGEDVLVVGAGASATDVALMVADVANSVTVSHRRAVPLNFPPEKNIAQRVTFANLTHDGASFVDGTAGTYGVVIFCTGYRFSFPFLSVDCGLTVKDRSIEPLYKHCININQPTMAIIGSTFPSLAALMTDLQARFCVQLFSQRKTLPSKEEMLLDLAADQKERQDRGFDADRSEQLFEDLQERYYKELAKVGDLQPIPDVAIKLLHQSLRARDACLLRFRDYLYKVDGDEFVIVKRPID
ncbi:senecionine N-oxygenase-like [Anopheles aquasalis]|uniref:senecionine N-oxygenase-like n=1 Tax=Anopheles aquasalis TaxID=42839 RepID=UPI00215B3D53|nr:senecionine N-oxygenase-like [Anopheles aquasalis]